LPWQAVRQGVDVKLLPHPSPSAQEQELYVLAQSHARIHKERAMRRRKLKWLWARLKQIAAMELTREELLMKLGAARAKARAAWRLIDVEVTPDDATFSFALNRDKLRQSAAAKGAICYAPICAPESQPICGSSISSSSRSRPHSKISRTICNSARSTTSSSTASKRTSSSPSWPIAFTSRCAPSSSRWRPALTPRAVLDKLAAIQMLDVHFPTTDGRMLILSRYTELNAEQKLLVNQLKLDLPSQPPPRITAPAGKPVRAVTQHL